MTNETKSYLRTAPIHLVTMPTHISLRWDDHSRKSDSTNPWLQSYALGAQFMPRWEKNKPRGRKEIKRGRVKWGRRGTPPKEDIRPDTKLLRPFLFPLRACCCQWRVQLREEGEGKERPETIDEEYTLTFRGLAKCWHKAGSSSSILCGFGGLWLEVT